MGRKIAIAVAVAAILGAAAIPSEVMAFGHGGGGGGGHGGGFGGGHVGGFGGGHVGGFGGGGFARGFGGGAQSFVSRGAVSPGFAGRAAVSPGFAGSAMARSFGGRGVYAYSGGRHLGWDGRGRRRFGLGPVYGLGLGLGAYGYDYGYDYGDYPCPYGTYYDGWSCTYAY